MCNQQGLKDKIDSMILSWETAKASNAKAFDIHDGAIQAAKLILAEIGEPSGCPCVGCLTTEDGATTVDLEDESLSDSET